MKGIFTRVCGLWFGVSVLSSGLGCRNHDEAIIRGARLDTSCRQAVNTTTQIPRVTIVWTGVDIESALRACTRMGPVSLLYEGRLVGQVDLTTSNAPLDHVVSEILATNGYGVVNWYGLNVIRTKEQIAQESQQPGKLRFDMPTAGDTIIDGGGFRHESVENVLRMISAVMHVDMDIPRCETQVTLLTSARGVEASVLLKAILRLTGQEIAIRQKRKPNHTPAGIRQPADGSPKPSE